jgi:RNA polymerase sigma-70 factor (ECF subfamily)
MTMSKSPSPQTRASLLFRLRDWQDTASWEEFYRLYRNLVFSHARRSGLTYNEAEEVTQDVFKRVAETVHSFEANPRRGSFRGWLLNLSRWRIADKFRARLPEEHHAASGWRDTPAGENVILERITDPRASDEAMWEIEWQHSLLEAALARLARRVPAKQFQAFDLYARRRWPVLRVARELGVNPATIYLVSHRLTKQLKADVARLKARLG